MILTIQPCEMNTTLAQGDAASAYGPGGTYGNLGFMTLRYPGGGNQDKLLVDANTIVIPSNSAVSQALLSVYFYLVSGVSPAGRTMTCRKLLRQDWVENQASWNVYKAANPWGAGGAAGLGVDSTNTDVVTAVMPVVNNWLTFNVTAQVQAAVTAGQRSIFLISDDAAGGSNFGALLYDRTEVIDVTLRPKLVVTYTPGPVTPVVTTLRASDIGLYQATLNAVLTDDGITPGGTVAPCNCCFEWGTTVAYGNVTPVQTVSKGQTFSAVIANLVPSTIYHFRAVASNGF